jgi:hypothetical protein
MGRMHEAPIIAACGLPAVHFAAYLTFKSVAYGIHSWQAVEEYKHGG